MRKIKDRMILGSVCALASTLPFQIYDYWIHKKGKTDVSYALSSSRVFLTKKASKTFGGKALSVLVNCVNVSIAGAALTYTLSATGKDYALLKGAGMGSMMWMAGAGLLSKLGLGIESKDPKTPLLDFVEHNAYFALCAYLITKLGDEGLFPDQSIREQKQVPLVYTGQRNEIKGKIGG